MKNPFIKVKFIKSPTGVYKLAYCPGEIAEFPALQAKELLDGGFVEFLSAPTTNEEVKEIKPIRKTRKSAKS